MCLKSGQPFVQIWNKSGIRPYGFPTFIASNYEGDPSYLARNCVHLNGVVAELVDPGQDVVGEVGVGVDFALERRDSHVTLVDTKRSGPLGSGMFHVVHLGDKTENMLQKSFNMYTKVNV